jgi:alpha-tubulin suppressor-like RCC1 family protein
MGSNIHGTLGSNPAINCSFVPTLAEGLADVTKIDCGLFHMCAIANGDLYSWGKGIDGQLGHGNTKNISKALKVEGFDGGVEEVSCGAIHTLVLVGGRGDVLP